MRQFCNFLSLSRVGLAVFFCCETVYFRLLAILGGMASDILDGYLARRYKATSRLGSILDPATDKFFVFVCVAMLYWEGSLSLAHLVLIFSRDLFLVLFAVYLSSVRGWKGYDCSALACGKIFTFAQFAILLGATAGMSIPATWLTPLIILGLLYFLERIIDYKKRCLD
ncbi:CDP-alcohol phosphatidyltransferase family protein [Chlamydia ibidis]|uniref:CDP-diacylglycerol--glycerol-3-phosphate 3-phosphatidyltransferase n=2 Tax=Chlamydia ibidis TaxID=1405396 RepID=S7J413_9CHLA|nr:CDP-alcohol phosphatidyltransferase family protein [Chlamydia ibidis]EPP34732.1 CDP-alcohol phosphatidyltransferase family protein [Chlamydia ibidis]EQM63052.1 CDP-alcohol phosphatidyltransferase family protein [Chlamydia ibidis 10-1398/6]